MAVLGPTVAKDLFADADPIGKTIRINKTNFKVIGVLQTKGSGGFFNPDDTVFVPLTTMQKILAGDDFLSTIAVSVISKELMPQAQEEATFALAEKHRIDPQSPDFSIVSQADILGTLTQVTDTFTIFLAAVAGISLICRRNSRSLARLDYFYRCFKFCRHCDKRFNLIGSARFRRFGLYRNCFRLLPRSPSLTP